MDIDVVLECRYFHTPDGAYWTPIMNARPFWDRYLTVFDNVRVFARSQLVEKAKKEWLRVDGDRVTVIPIPYYIGPFQYLLKRQKIIKTLEQKIGNNAAVLFRVGSPIADLAVPILKRRNQPYAVEVVGDPWDMFSPGSTRNPFRPFFRKQFSDSLKKQCAGACAAAYVTAGALQKRYPPAEGAITKNYSSIILSENDFASEPRLFSPNDTLENIVTVGTMEFMYKGIIDLLDAIKICTDKSNRIFKLTLVGEGRLRPVFEAHAEKIGVGDQVRFTGLLSAGEAVRNVVSQADLFVLPSRSEGLPRAMIEAMALGMPCIGTSVGGIPELLEDKYLLTPGQPEELSGLILKLLSDPEELTNMSTQNHEKVRQYTDAEIAPNRDMIYNHLKEKTRESLDD
jgi:glycosyltransferase involved in cell wall biosynthesis